MRSIGVIFAFAAGVASAQGYPSKPIRMISPVPAGSGIDVVARIAADKLAQNMGATIVVDNIAGAASMIGAAAAARAAPDGYTLLFWSEAAPLGALANPKLTFDPVKDLQPVGSLAKWPIRASSIGGAWGLPGRMSRRAPFATRGFCPSAVALTRSCSVSSASSWASSPAKRRSPSRRARPRDRRSRSARRRAPSARGG